MSEECTHDCSSCGSNCAERVEEQKNKDNYAGVKKVIAVVSGKGGVGKSMVTSLLAVNSAKNGLKPLCSRLAFGKFHRQQLKQMLQ